MTTTQNVRWSTLLKLNNEIISLEQKIMNRLKSFIEKGFRRQRQPKYYSQLMRLPIHQLDLLSLKYCGGTVSNLIQSRLFSEAIIQLIFSSTNIQNISYQLGFTQPSNFNTWFKRQMGQTPSEFRKKNRINPESLARQLASQLL